MTPKNTFEPADPSHLRYQEAVTARLPWLRDLEQAGNDLTPA